MHSDPIADLLTRVRNAAQASSSTVEVPLSRVKLEIVKILENEGYISGHEIITDSKFPKIRIALKYSAPRKPMFRHLKRTSTPGLRVYTACKDLRPLRNGLGTQIVSTNKGIVTDREARRLGVGGELICEVW